MTVDSYVYNRINDPNDKFDADQRIWTPLRTTEVTLLVESCKIKLINIDRWNEIDNKTNEILYVWILQITNDFNGATSHEL